MLDQSLAFHIVSKDRPTAGRKFVLESVLLSSLEGDLETPRCLISLPVFYLI
jgi:hypothetical protein